MAGILRNGNEMGKLVYVTPNDSYSYSVRGKYVEKFFEKKGYEVIVLTSDFDHRKKEYYNEKRTGVIQIHVPAYKKNLSIQRMWSHYCFTMSCRKFVENSGIDIIYVSAPPNLLIRSFAKLKEKNKNIKIIYEIGDMWPETLPMSDKLKKIAYLPLCIWAYLRNHYIKYGDYVLCECNLFRNKIKSYIQEEKTETLYMCKEDTFKPNISIKNLEEINFLYLGSINNIIDMEKIALFVSKVRAIKKVNVHIIGEGENRKKFIDMLDNAGATIKFHGIVYDEDEKEKIASICHFAFNIMKESVCVGVSMKSIDYFQHGLPIINNISHDTEEIVERYQCGFNMANEDISKLAERICKLDSIQVVELKNNARNVYEKLFSEKTFNRKFEKIYKIVHD